MASTRACWTIARGQGRQDADGRRLLGGLCGGGAVRDLLLGMVPKDFDVATNATPEQVKAFPPGLHHWPALPHRPRGVWPGPRARGDRGLDLPCADDRRSEQVEGNEDPSASWRASPAWWTPVVACCATTSGARRSKTPAARLHRQRHVLRARSPDGGGLPRRSGRREEAKVLRMIGDPRPATAKTGAHHSRGALCGQSWALTSRPRRRAHPGARVGAPAGRCRVAPVRRDGRCCCRPAMRWPAWRRASASGLGAVSSRCWMPC